MGSVHHRPKARSAKSGDDRAHLRMLGVPRRRRTAQAQRSASTKWPPAASNDHWSARYAGTIDRPSTGHQVRLADSQPAGGCLLPPIGRLTIRQVVVEMVDWSTPTRHAANSLNISDTGLKKHCRRKGVPFAARLLEQASCWSPGREDTVARSSCPPRPAETKRTIQGATANETVVASGSAEKASRPFVGREQAALRSHMSLLDLASYCAIEILASSVGLAAEPRSPVDQSAKPNAVTSATMVPAATPLVDRLGPFQSRSSATIASPRLPWRSSRTA